MQAMISRPVILGSFQDLVSIITLPTTRMICKKKDGCIESFLCNLCVCPAGAGQGTKHERGQENKP